MAQKFSEYFELEEFLVSSTARQKSIENVPSWEVVQNLHSLAQFLDWLRQDWGSGIRITSGFRCEKLNKVVGGQPSSLHLKGWAADIQPVNGKMKEFKKFVVEWAKDKLFDEIILEHNKKTEWIHIQLRSNNGFQRKKVFSLAA